jgi:hypothetical protein
MAFSQPRPFKSYRLNDARAQELWNWLLRRQGLSDETRLRSVETIANAALGLHSARLPSPFSTVAARGTGAEVALSLFREETRNKVVTLRCMRKTLHTLPLALAAAAHRATLRFRERDALRALVNANVEAGQVLGATNILLDLLAASGPIFHREIESKLALRDVDLQAARLTLKLAWERGIVSYINQACGWNREVRKFALTQQAYPELDLSLSCEAATAILVDAYFDRYGPASLGDVAWWSGLSRSVIVQALADAGRELVMLETPWSNAPLYMYGHRFEQFRDTTREERATGVNLLAHEDVALKAYFETRSRYLGTLPTRRAFNQIGEVLPTVVHDGRVIGTWSWSSRRHRVETRLVPGSVPTDQRVEVQARAYQLSNTLQRGWSASSSTVANIHQSERSTEPVQCAE